eukprot:TRINITY_DN23174_c0_g2_i1.p1 TRINITY_DN23174_c0_g2~~TRINITY_DN23174_c0_g2_i1.p1  ORF type:complete len:316 (+),score=46.99 TRINITY_DN23174_c0_g2_i1:40-987(+)
MDSNASYTGGYPVHAASGEGKLPAAVGGVACVSCSLGDPATRVHSAACTCGYPSGGAQDLPLACNALVSIKDLADLQDRCKDHSDSESPTTGATGSDDVLSAWGSDASPRLRRAAAANLFIEVAESASSSGSEDDAASESSASDGSNTSSPRGRRRRKRGMYDDDILEVGDDAQVFHMATPEGDKINMTVGVEVFQMLTPTGSESSERGLTVASLPVPDAVKKRTSHLVTSSNERCTDLHGKPSEPLRLADSPRNSSIVGPGIESAQKSTIDDIGGTGVPVSDTLQHENRDQEPEDDCDHESWESSSQGSLDSLP